MSLKLNDDRDLAARDYFSLVFLAGLLIAAWWMLPKILKTAGDATALLTHVVATLSAIGALYAVLSTLRLRQADAARGFRLATFTIYSDVSEALREIASLRQRFTSATEANTWNEVVADMDTMETRILWKQDRLGILGQQFTPDIFPQIQDLYLDMQRLTSRSKQYEIQLPQSFTTTVQQAALTEKRQAVCAHIDEIMKSIRKRYSEIKSVIPELTQLI